MPQFRILISVMVDSNDFNLASIGATDYAMLIRQRGYGPLVKDVRVLKVEDVSPPSFDTTSESPPPVAATWRGAADSP